MSARETPLQAVKRIYGDRDKLVSQLAASLQSAGEDAGELKERLLKVSNKKLLRLAEVSKTVKDKYGDKDKLAAALADAVGKAKDSDYLAKLRTYSPGKLLDMMSAATKRAKK
jgi:hypothetical protein